MSKPDQDSVTKKGTIIYKVGASAIRDDGDKLKVSREATKEGLEAALRMAMERYGNHITVNGTDDFKERIVRAAVVRQYTNHICRCRLRASSAIFIIISNQPTGEQT